MAMMSPGSWQTTFTRDCLDAIWQVALHVGQLQGILIEAGSRQQVEPPEGWMAPPISLPIGDDARDEFDTVSAHLALAVSEIATGCMDYLPDIPGNPAASHKQLNAIGEANLFENPFQRDPEQRGRQSAKPDAKQLWFEINMIQDFVMDWVDEIFLEPSRYATTGALRR